MGILSFFKRKNKTADNKAEIKGNVNADTIHLWEDDYCQVEILPRENLNYAKTQTKAIDQFSQEHKTEHGFTDIYVRQGNPHPTKSKLIKVSDLENVLTTSGQSRIKNINIQFQGLVDFDNGNTRAFGDKNFAVFYDFTDNLVDNIWITSNGIQEKHASDRAATTMKNLGDRFGFILVDWNSSEIIDLQDSEQVRNYFNAYNEEK
jgi:hypothetical protein